MPDRLAELRRQRALVAEHLAWLDREIAAAAPSPVGAFPPPSPRPAVAPPPSLDPAAILAAAAAPPSAPVAEPDPLAHLVPERPPAAIKQDVRLGCFLYLFLATVGLVGFCALIYWGSQKYKASHPRAEPTHEVEDR